MFDSGSVGFEGTDWIEHVVVKGTEERERGGQALWLWPTQWKGTFFVLRILDLGLSQFWNMRLINGILQKPYVESKGRKFEKARGRRRSRGFKV